MLPAWCAPNNEPYSFASTLGLGLAMVMPTLSISPKACKLSLRYGSGLDWCMSICNLVASIAGELRKSLRKTTIVEDRTAESVRQREKSENEELARDRCRGASSCSFYNFAQAYLTGRRQHRPIAKSLRIARYDLSRQVSLIEDSRRPWHVGAMPFKTGPQSAVQRFHTRFT